MLSNLAVFLKLFMTNKLVLFNFFFFVASSCCCGGKLEWEDGEPQEEKGRGDGGDAQEDPGTPGTCWKGIIHSSKKSEKFVLKNLVVAKNIFLTTNSHWLFNLSFYTLQSIHEYLILIFPIKLEKGEIHH